jgi:alcohol dehydrogenase class IV
VYFVHQFSQIAEMEADLLNKLILKSVYFSAKGECKVMVSSLRMPRNIHYGKGAFQKLGEEVALLGKKGLIISDHIMEQLGNVKKCEDVLDEIDVSHAKYLDVNSEPTDQYVYESLELLKQENCQFIIALGGGSCIDTAKAVAVLATNGGDISDYMNQKTIAMTRPLPLIAIPTTAGTGSEVTDVTVITNTSNDVKMMIKQPAFLPEIAIVDPVLTVSSPKNTTSATGMDALTHAVEAYISRLAHPFTDTLALSAIKLIIGNIRDAYSDGRNLQAREKMSYAAMLAGMAFSDASVCLVHGMSRPIGAMFHVPHGISNAMLFPAVLEFSKESCTERLAEIANYVFNELEGLTDEQKADKVVSEIKTLCFDLNIPNLNGWGIQKDEFDCVLQKMAKDAIISGSPGNNPSVSFLVTKVKSLQTLS